MAATFASRMPESVQGLVLWAAYPSAADDLSSSGLNVASIYATLDGLATGEQIEASRALLPANTTWTVIDGGNHAQFGWYGEQSGDNPATISRSAQQALIVQSTLALLERMK
jgi:pimeloyl-ACP methyl ester carboxylesterase